MARPLSLSSLPPVRETMRRHALTPRKGMGQHFLLDPGITARIAAAGAPYGAETVIEVGPGPGGLTRALLEAGAAAVVAIERDRRCVALLGELEAEAEGRLKVIEADARQVDLTSLAPPGAKIVANLPYQVASLLLVGWLRRIAHFQRLVLMFQKEVAVRLAAGPGSRAYGRLSVLSQWLCEVDVLFDIAAGAFLPPPAVTSTLVRLVPRPAPLAPADAGALEQVLKAAFGRRRKMLRSALKTLAPAPEALLGEAGIAPTRRAESLSVAEFCALARAYAAARRGETARLPLAKRRGVE